jgi:hypothetical protein
MVPVRVVDPGFADTTKSTVPFPVSLMPTSMTTQGTSLTAVHAQLAAAVTSKDPPVDPVEPTDVPLALSVPAQPPPDAPAWLMVKACPATLMLAARGLDEPFVATEYVTVPLPGPLPAAVIHD